MEFNNNGKVLETVIDKRETVQRKYDDAVAAGKTAVMGSHAATNASSSTSLVRIAIGNLPPMSEAKLTVYFYQQADTE